MFSSKKKSRFEARSISEYKRTASHHSKVKLTTQQLESFKNEYNISDHLISIKELEEKYNTNVKIGLTSEEAAERLHKEGPNCLASPPNQSLVLIFPNLIFCGFNILLWVATLLGLVAFTIHYLSAIPYAEEHLYFATCCVLVIFITGTFGFCLETNNIAVINSFQKMVPKTATVLRNGIIFTIPSENVVLGDLAIIRAGEWIPADVRVVESHSLKVDHSTITGESVAQFRSADCTDSLPLETENLVFYSTFAVEGSGKGIVVKRGDETLIGNIAGLATSLKTTQTPIRREINYVIKFVTVIAVIIGTVCFILCLIYKFSFVESFSYFVALLVSNVPEGLPVTLTACMALTSKRMALKNCMVKKLEAIETLGCTTVICSDKTGTLTQNKMRVIHLFYDNQPFPVFVDGAAIERNSLAFQALCQCAILCNTASFVKYESYLAIDERKTVGDASESAILKNMESLVGNIVQKRRQHKKVCEIPFNSRNKYQVSIHEAAGGYVLLMKGAPERIIDRCISILLFDETIPLTADNKRLIQRAIDHLGLKGERVLAFADIVLPHASFGHTYQFDATKRNFPLSGLRFIGLISMMDPPRPNVPDAVSKCQSAGIRVIMVTGDHPLTAAAVARQVGILSPGSVTAYDIALQRDVAINTLTEPELEQCSAAVITGQDLREMASFELENIVVKYQEIVFARTSPTQKLKIVEAFQKVGHIVAVTGDGVNDSPALKKADIGIAMGITGTDVAKEAAEMILVDDNFASIVTGVEEGRLIFDNLKKSIVFLLSSSVPEIVPFILLIFGGIPPAIGVLPILVINVGADLWPAISLAYEKAEADIMTRLPRDPNYDKLVNHRLLLLSYGQIGLIQACACLASYYMCMMQHGFFPEILWGLRQEWADQNAIVVDSYGQAWSFEERKILTRRCYSASFMSICITQIADLLICKTRRLSLFEQGMSNWVLNAGIFVEVCIAGIAVYTPGVRTFLHFEPIGLNILLPTIPFAAIIISYDEIRKTFIRKFPGGIIDRETYY